MTIASAAGSVIPNTFASDNEHAAAVRRKCWRLVRLGMAISGKRIARIYPAGHDCEMQCS